ncbi:MAG: methyltransferase family protein [Microcystaceae cyanobacterium]
MNQLKNWGFSTHWWRGDKGEYWVLGQFLLLIIFVLLPVYPGMVADSLSPIAQYCRWGLIALAGGLAVVFFVGGKLALGGNLTPLPHPKEDGSLVTTGIYRWVRHPLYSGVIFAAIAYSAWQWSLTKGLTWVFFFFFFHFKANQEEAWLKQKFSEYATYQTQVKKLIPWIY